MSWLKPTFHAIAPEFIPGGAIVLLLLFLLPGVSAQTSSQLTGENYLRLRLGPGYGFPGLYSIPPASEVTLVAASPDERWIEISYANLTGWVEKDALPELNIALPTETDLPPEPAQTTENCVSLVGDSVPYGDVVYMVPGHGFGVLRYTPLSVRLQEQLEKNGLGYLEVRDRTASAAFLSEDGKFPYFAMDEYQSLLQDRCRFIVLMPWINDLSVERENGAEAHIAEMQGFLETLHDNSPDSEILALGFYYGVRADFVEAFAPGYTDENITAFNAAFFAACDRDGAWGAIDQVSCLAIDPLFADLEYEHVVQNGTQAMVEANLYEPIPDDVAPFFEVYWRDNPAGEVVGDGVHLSELGKELLTQAIVVQMLWIEPKL